MVFCRSLRLRQNTTSRFGKCRKDMLEDIFMSKRSLCLMLIMFFCALLPRVTFAEESNLISDYSLGTDAEDYDRLALQEKILKMEALLKEIEAKKALKEKATIEKVDDTVLKKKRKEQEELEKIEKEKLKKSLEQTAAKEAARKELEEQQAALQREQEQKAREQEEKIRQEQEAQKKLEEALLQDQLMEENSKEDPVVKVKVPSVEDLAKLSGEGMQVSSGRIPGEEVIFNDSADDALPKIDLEDSSAKREQDVVRAPEEEHPTPEFVKDYEMQKEPVELSESKEEPKVEKFPESSKAKDVTSSTEGSDDLEQLKAEIKALSAEFLTDENADNNLKRIEEELNLENVQEARLEPTQKEGAVKVPSIEELNQLARKIEKNELNEVDHNKKGSEDSGLEEDDSKNGERHSNVPSLEELMRVANIKESEGAQEVSEESKEKEAASKPVDHDGIFVSNRFFQYELQFHSDGYIRLYLNSVAGKVIYPKSVDARFILHPDAEDPIEGKFLPARGDVYLWRKVDPITQSTVKIRVEIRLGEEWVPQDFHVSFEE